MAPDFVAVVVRRATAAKNSRFPRTSCTRLVLLLCVSAWLVLVPGSARSQKLHLRSYNTADGLPTAQVFSCFQDSHGYIWFGTAGGLVRYNGVEYKNFTMRDGLSSDVVRNITEYDGVIWLATENGVSVFDGKNFKRFDGGGGIEGVVWKIVPHRGELWFASMKNGLLRWNGNDLLSYTQKDGLSSDNIFTILSDGNDLWLGTRGGGLMRFDGAVFHAFGAQHGLNAKDVFALAKHGGTLWVGTREAGLFRLDDRRFVQVVPGVIVYSVATSATDAFWGTLGHGVLRFRGDELRRYTTANGLTGDRIYSIVIDREGSVWFTSNSGVTKLLSDKFLGYHERTNVVAVRQYDNAIWFGTLGSGLIAAKAGESRSYTTSDGVPSDAIWNLTTYRRKLWLATSAGIASFDGQHFQRYGREHGLPDAVCYHLYADGDDLWVSTYDGIVRYDGQHFQRWGTAEGLVSNTVRSGARVGERMCFATEGGVSCFDGRVFTNYTKADGLPSNGAYAVYGDGSGTMWVGTNAGLSRLDGNRFVTYTQEDGLSNENVNSIIEYDRILWLGTNRGLNGFDGNRAFLVYDQRNGLIGDEINISSFFIDQEQSLWIGTSNGAARYLRKEDKPNRTPPLVAIERFLVNGVTIDPAGDLQLRHDHNSVFFSFAGLSYKDESAVRFSYFLEGYDEHWSEPTRDSVIRYTNLDHGPYRFLVVARNADGLQSVAPAALSFEILTPWWLTWWFRGSAVLVLIIGVALVARMVTEIRVRQLRRRARELERLVNLRTRELNNANIELKELSLTDPLTGLRNRRYLAETVRSDVDRIKRALAELSRGRTALPNFANVSFLIVDVDHFKKINDIHGHNAGDQVLREITQRLRDGTRGSDELVRWGGEEFLLMCRNVNPQFIFELAQRIRHNVMDRAFEVDKGKSVMVTVSIGFSFYPLHAQESDSCTYEDVIGLADHALYVAKRSGRNQVIGIVAGAEPILAEHKTLVKTDPAKGVELRLLSIVRSKQDLIS